MQDLPGKGLFGWLGRQVGHVRRAIKAGVGPQTIYRQRDVREVPLPNQTEVTLRRTTIDEVVIDRSKPRTPRSNDELDPV